MLVESQGSDSRRHVIKEPNPVNFKLPHRWSETYGQNKNIVFFFVIEPDILIKYLVYDNFAKVIINEEPIYITANVTCLNIKISNFIWKFVQLYHVLACFWNCLSEVG